MPKRTDLGIEVIKKFVDKAKQDRYIQFVSSPKNRHKFIGDLAHFNFFRCDLFEGVTGNEEPAIFQALHKDGVTDKTRYVISENADIDTLIGHQRSNQRNSRLWHRDNSCFRSC